MFIEGVCGAAGSSRPISCLIGRDKLQLHVAQAQKKTRQKRVFLFVELPGVEPGSGEGKDGAFYMCIVS